MMKKILGVTLILTVALPAILSPRVEAQTSSVKCSLIEYRITIGVGGNGSVRSRPINRDNTQEALLCGRAIQAFAQEISELGIQVIEDLLERRWFQGVDSALSEIDWLSQKRSITIPQPIQEQLLFLAGRLEFQKGTELPYRLGLQYLKKSEEHWQQRLDERESHPLYYNALGFTYYNQKNWNKAVNSWCQTLLLINKREPSVSLCQSFDFSSLNTADIDKEILSINADANTAYAGIALVLYQLGWENSSLEQQKEAIQLQKNILAEASTALNLDALPQNWLWSNTAIENWRRMLEKEPALQPCFLPKRVEQWTREISEYRQNTIKIKVSDRDTLCSLGTSIILSREHNMQFLMTVVEEFLHRKNLNEVEQLLLAAISSSRESLRFAPDFSWNYNYAFGKWSWLVGRSTSQIVREAMLSGSQRYWTSTLQEVSSEPLYYNILGFAEFMLGDEDEAIRRWCESLLVLERKQPEISVCPSVNFNNIPILATERAKDINSSAASAYAGLVLALFQYSQKKSPQDRNQLEEALQLQQKAIEEYPQYFTTEALQNNWLWTKELLFAWQTL